MGRSCNLFKIFDGATWRLISAAKDLKVGIQFVSIIRLKLLPPQINILKSLKNIDSISNVRIVLSTVNDVPKIFQNLSIGIGQKSTLQQLTLDLTNCQIELGDEASNYLSKCFCRNLSCLKISFLNMNKDFLANITKGLLGIVNLLEFDLEILNSTNIEIKQIFQVLQNQKSLRKLKVDINNQGNAEESKESAKINLIECNNLQLSIDSFLSISSLKLSENLKTVGLIITKQKKSILDYFINYHLPGLQGLSNLVLIFKYLDKKILKFLEQVIKNLQQLKSLKIKLKSEKNNNLAEIVQIVSFNKHISRLKITNKNFLYLILDQNVFTDLINIKNLDISSNYDIKEESFSYRNFNKLENLLTLKVNKNRIPKDCYLKAKRLVTFN